MGNCIYIDAGGKCWLANAKILGEGDIILIKDLTEKVIKKFSVEFLGRIEKPYILFFDENDDLAGISAKGMRVVQQS